MGCAGFLPKSPKNIWTADPISFFAQSLGIEISLPPSLYMVRGSFRVFLI